MILGVLWSFAFCWACFSQSRKAEIKRVQSFLVSLHWSGSERLLLPHKSSYSAETCKLSLDDQSGSLIVNSSFLQSICIIGYTLFPLVIAALLSALRLPMLARLPVFIVLIIWSLAAGISILMGSGIVKNRVAIAAYPLFVFYVGLGCLCLISWQDFGKGIHRIVQSNDMKIGQVSWRRSAFVSTPIKDRIIHETSTPALFANSK